MKARNPVERIDKEPESSDVLESVQKGETPETVLQIPLDELHDFRNHPFRVEVNDELKELTTRLQLEKQLLDAGDKVKEGRSFVDKLISGTGKAMNLTSNVANIAGNLSNMKEKFNKLLGNKTDLEKLEDRSKKLELLNKISENTKKLNQKKTEQELADEKLEKDVKRSKNEEALLISQRNIEAIKNKLPQGNDKNDKQNNKKDDSNNKKDDSNDKQNNKKDDVNSQQGNDKKNTRYEYGNAKGVTMSSTLNRILNRQRGENRPKENEPKENKSKDEPKYNGLDADKVMRDINNNTKYHRDIDQITERQKYNEKFGYNYGGAKGTSMSSTLNRILNRKRDDSNDWEPAKDDSKYHRNVDDIPNSPKKEHRYEYGGAKGTSMSSTLNRILQQPASSSGSDRNKKTDDYIRIKANNHSGPWAARDASDMRNAGYVLENGYWIKKKKKN